jgi:flagellar protein FliS
MNPSAAQNYLKTKVLTATPEQLQMMLYDGALRFGEQARVAMNAGKFDESYDLITRVQKIVLELNCSLKHEVAPDVCGKLSALYNYVYRKLIEANVAHDAKAMEEAIELLRYQRETWALLLERLSKDKAGKAAMRLDMPAPDARMEASISFSG